MAGLHLASQDLARQDAPQPPLNVVHKSTTYTAVANDAVLADASGGGFTVTLPTAAINVRVSVKKIDTSANVVTVVPATGTIDGSGSFILGDLDESRDFVSDGTNWFVVASDGSAAPFFETTGLTGAQQPVRWVGRHDGGHPITGTFQAGDFTTDWTTPGIWVCTVAGSPGTWVNIIPTSSSPTGAAGGDLAGSYPNPTLAAAGPGATGPIGDSTHVPVITIDAKGRVVALSSAAISSFTPARATVTYTTASLADGGNETGLVAMAKGYRVIVLQTDRPARVRLYATAAQRDADVSRSVSTTPSATSGVVLDYVTVTGALIGDLSPQPIGDNLETSPTVNIPITVTNLSGATSTVAVTLTFVAME